MAKVSRRRRTHDMPYTEELFDVYAEAFRALPLSHLRLLLLNLDLPKREHSALIANSTLPFLSTRPTKIDILNLTEADLLKWILPYEANSTTAVDNAKLSLLVELLLSDWISEKKLKFSHLLFTAIKQGVEARNKKAIGGGRRKSKGQSDQENLLREELENSGQRIILHIELLGTSKSNFVAMIKLRLTILYSRSRSGADA